MTMPCDCCDPTNDSPDPYVRRLEQEIEELKRRLDEAESRDEQHLMEACRYEAKWRDAEQRLADATELLREACDHAERTELGLYTCWQVSVSNGWYERAKEVGGE
jgi:chromosome segregation ATPase